MAPTIPQYNLTSVSNASGNKLVALLQYTSSETNYLPGLLILLMMFIVVFLALKIRGFRTSSVFTAASSVMLVMGLLMYPIGIISGKILVVCIVLIPISAFMLFIDK